METMDLDCAPIALSEVLKRAGLASSISEALRVIDQEAVRIDGLVVLEPDLQLDAGNYSLQVGKRFYTYLRLTGASQTTAMTPENDPEEGRTRPLTLKEAEKVVDGIEAWVGWEGWEADPSRIVLDGTFTIQELESLVMVLNEDDL